MSKVIKIYIPNETSANSVGANMLYKTISNLIKEESVKIIRKSIIMKYIMCRYSVRIATRQNNIHIGNLNWLFF